MEKSVGFIGVGEMGLPMAKNLIKAGHELTVYDIDEKPLAELEKMGAHISGSPGEAARGAGTIIIIVRTVDQVKAVMMGENGVLSSAKPPSIILIMSTIDPGTAQEMNRLGAEQEVAVLDCPVSGAKQGAEAGTLTIMVGGAEEIYKKCKPILDVLGKNIFYLGGSGMGESAKLINNLLLLIHTNAAFEAVALGNKAGVKMDVLFDLLKVSTGNSWVIEHWDLIKAWTDHYEEGGTFDLFYKDIKLAMVMGETLKVPLHLSGLAAQLGRY